MMIVVAYFLIILSSSALDESVVSVHFGTGLWHMVKADILNARNGLVGDMEDN